VRANATAPTHFRRVELQGNGDEVGCWRGHDTGAPSWLTRSVPHAGDCELPSVGAPIAMIIRSATVQAVRPV
jgi:hypothetical protein